MSRVESRDFIGHAMSQKRRSPCPIACALDLFGDKWTMLIVRDLACGKAQFKEFSASPERIATNILTDRLKRLTGAGLVEKHAVDDTAGRDAYRLTAKGRTLLPILNSIAEWGLTHIRSTEARMRPIQR